MWLKHQTAPSRVRDLRRRLVFGLALLLQLLSVTVFQAEHHAAAMGGAGAPCPMHAGMVMPAHTGHDPGKPASPTQNCPCCGVACACASVQVALPADDFIPLPPISVGVAASRVPAKALPPARRHLTAASARGPPSRSA